MEEQLPIDIHGKCNLQSSEVNEHLLLKAKDELGETDTVREENTILIKKWIQSHSSGYSHLGKNAKYVFVCCCLSDLVLLDFNLDDLSIRWFLRGCKFDLNRTKARIENFFLFRSKITEWYSDRDPLSPELLEILNLG